MMGVENSSSIFFDYLKTPANFWFDVNKSWKEHLRKGVALSEALTKDYPHLGPTPKETVWTKGYARLYHYESPVPKEERKKVPILLNFAFMNDPRIWDLRPGGSFVQFLSEKGYDVNSLDCGVPGPLSPWNTGMGFGEYDTQILHRAVNKVKENSGSDKISLVTWCQGAEVGVIEAALHPDDVNNLVLLTAGLHFDKEEDKKDGFMKQILDYHIDEKWINQVTGVYNGLIPGEFINMGALSLKPFENFVGGNVAMYNKAKDGQVSESMWAVNTWMRKLKPMTGKAYEELVLQFYLNNDLAEGRFEVNGQKVRLQDIKASTLMLIAKQDHIVSPAQSRRAFPLIGSSDKELVEMDGGHVGVMVGKQGYQAWNTIDKFLSPRSN